MGTNPTPSVSVSDFHSRETKKILVVGTIGYDQKIYMEEIPKIGETKTGSIEINLGEKEISKQLLVQKQEKIQYFWVVLEIKII